MESANGAKLAQLLAQLCAVYLGKLPVAVFVAFTSGLLLPQRHKYSNSGLVKVNIIILYWSYLMFRKYKQTLTLTTIKIPHTGDTESLDV